MREWTLTLPSEFPLWELDSRWTPKFSGSNFRGQNPLDWNFPYIIGNFFERRCLKWAPMTHFGWLKHKLWPKERLEVKLAIWFPTIKSQESPRFPFVQVACNIQLESSWWKLQFYFGPHFNQRSAHKVMDLQSRGNLNFGNFETSTWESRNKMTIGCWPRGHAHNIL
jgi:hypothetical protein